MPDHVPRPGATRRVFASRADEQAHKEHPRSRPQHAGQVRAQGKGCRRAIESCVPQVGRRIESLASREHPCSSPPTTVLPRISNYAFWRDERDKWRVSVRQARQMAGYGATIEQLARCGATMEQLARCGETSSQFGAFWLQTALSGEIRSQMALSGAHGSPHVCGRLARRAYRTTFVHTCVWLPPPTSPNPYL